MEDEVCCKKCYDQNWVCGTCAENELEKYKRCLNMALDYQVANRGTKREFYACCTPDELPEWVKMAKKLLKEK